MTQTKLIPKRLDGKIAVITGGSSGIGLATTERFVQDGAYAFIFGRGQNEIDAAVRRIGKNVTGVQGDVSNLADLDRPDQDPDSVKTMFLQGTGLGLSFHFTKGRVDENCRNDIISNDRIR